jgi:hypothetical protein
LEKNGKVKFIFFTLAQLNTDVETATIAFNHSYAPNISLEIIDIQRIRKNYIEFKFKEVKTNNPLEYHYDPEDSKIELEIERFNKRDFLEFNGRAEAYIFILKPKTIYELFKKYRFSLFFKNVRNPIHRSNYNEKMVETLLKKPNAFWYFNNGITAITKIMPEVGIHAKKIKLEGLQVINGAQTVYSIYQAYQNATRIQRVAMDSDARMTFRLIRSSDEEFNMQITRYTNSQNPMEDRDFWANDSVQQRLQNQSFTTNFWYEKRRDEFRLTKVQQEKLNIDVVSNVDFISNYLAFHLQNPVDSFNENHFFVSHREDKEGLYEIIFNETTRFEDLLASKIMNDFVKTIFKTHSIVFQRTILALSKEILQKYFMVTRPNDKGKFFNLNFHLIMVKYKKKITEQLEILKILKYTGDKLIQWCTDEGEEDLAEKLVIIPAFYEILKNAIEKEPLNIEKIQSIEPNEVHTWTQLLQR